MLSKVPPCAPSCWATARWGAAKRVGAPSRGGTLKVFRYIRSIGVLLYDNAVAGADILVRCDLVVVVLLDA